MRRFALIAALASTAMLAACDSYTRLAPEFLRYAPPPAAEPEPEPDVPKIVRDNLAVMFLAQSAPKNVEASRPVRAGAGWTACVRAQVTGMTNAEVGLQTFRVAIERGKITRRERVDQTHACASEIFAPI